MIIVPKIPKRKIVYEAPLFKVEEWLSPETNARFARITGYDAVAILPILENGNILMERQWRHSIDSYHDEIPAGKIEEGHTPEFTARKELEEETGYRIGKLTHMFSLYPSVGTKTELMHFFLAENLIRTKENKEPDEIIETYELTLSEALKRIKENKIKDGKTYSAILYYAHFLKK